MPGAVFGLLSGAATARIATEGGAILLLVRDGMPLLRPTLANDAKPIDSACHSLMPFASGIRGNRFAFDGHEHVLAPITDWDPHQSERQPSTTATTSPALAPEPGATLVGSIWLTAVPLG